MQISEDSDSVAVSVCGTEKHFLSPTSQNRLSLHEANSLLLT